MTARTRATIRGHKTIAAAALVLATTLAGGSDASARTFEGREFAETEIRAGRTLHLTGLGMRSKYVFDVYVLGAYTESGACDTARMVRDDEAKLLRLAFVRDVPARRMVKEVRGMVAARVPATASDFDRGQSEAFIAMFDQDVADGAVFEMLYVPGVGTTVTRDGRPQGATLTGKPFQEVLWDTYVGPEPCCPKTKKQLLESCGTR
jgi:hypothetical protein